jgi:autotransporter-associated beta strand protein
MFSFSSWLRNTQNGLRRTALRRSTVRLGLERCEDRIVPDSGGSIGQLFGPGPLVYGGGPIIQNVQVEPIFVVDPTNSSYTALESGLYNFFPTIVTNGFIPQQLAQYNTTNYTIGTGTEGKDDGNASYAPDTSVPDINNNTVPAYSDAFIQTIIESEIQAGRTDAPNANTLYYVFTPPDAAVTNSLGSSINSFYQYHGNFVDGGGNNIYYAVIPDQSNGFPDGSGNASFSGIGYSQLQTEEVMSTNALATAITNPIANTGWANPNFTPVDGDVGILALAEGYTLDGQQAQYLWSNGNNSFYGYPASPMHALPTPGNVNNLVIDQLAPPLVDSVSTTTPFPVATFTDPNPALNASSFQAFVDFDDGNGLQTATITEGSNGFYTVSANPVAALPDGQYGTPYAGDGMYVFLADAADGGFFSGAPETVRYIPYQVVPTAPMIYMADNGGIAHNFRLVENQGTGNIELYDNGLLVFTQPAAVTTNYIVLGTDPGADASLTVDYSGGLFNLPIYFDGGSGSGAHTVTIKNGSFNSVNFEASSATSSVVTLDSQQIIIIGTTQVTSTVTSNNDTVHFDNGSDQITVTDSGTANETSVKGNLTPTINFVNPKVGLLLDDAGDTNNTITVNGFGSGFTAGLDVNFPDPTDAVQFNASIALGSATSMGTLTITCPTIAMNAATISTDNGGANGSVTFNGAVLLEQDLDLTVGSGSVMFEPLDGSHALSIHGTGMTTFTTDVGDNAALSGFSADGPVTISGGNFLVNGAVDFGGDVTLTTSVHLMYSGVPGLTDTGAVLDLGSNQLYLTDVQNTDGGSINAQITGAGGQLVIQDLGVLTITNASNNFTGGTTILSGIIQINQQGDLGDPTVAVQVQNATLEITAPIVMSQAIAIAANCDTTFLVDLGQSLELTTPLTSGANGGITLTGGGSLIFDKDNTYSGATTINGGTLVLNGFGTIDSTLGVTVDGGTLTGSGTVAGPVVVNNGGTLSSSSSGLTIGGSLTANAGATVSPGPAGAIGELFIGGDYTQNAGATLNIKISGNTTPGGDYDTLAITGNANLDGAINVSLINGFNPSVGDSYQILSFAGSSGDFATHSSYALGNARFLTEQFNPASLDLLVNQALLKYTLQPANPELSGQAFNVQVSVTDGSGNVLGFDSTDQVTVTLNQNTFHDGTTSKTITAASGVANFTLTIDTTGNGYQLTAGNNGFLGIASSVFSVDLAAAITSANNATFIVGHSAIFTVSTNGFPTPSLTETGALPNGVTFVDAGNGTASLSGTPAAGSAGIYTFTITAHNGIGSDATQNFTLQVNQVAAITSGNHTTYTTGQAGSFTVTTTGFPTPSLSETGALPSGVSFTDNGDGTATLSGTAAGNAGGVYTFTITAHNGVLGDATQTFTLTVLQSPTITSATSKTFTVGSVGSFTVQTIGFPAPALTESGALPNGVTFTDNGNGTANLSGTPTGNVGGVYTLTFTAHNGVGSDNTQTFTLTVDQQATISSPNTTTFIVGQAGTFTVTTLGFPTPALSEAATLPAGLTFVDNGDGTATLGGTPTGNIGGTYAFTITAHNGVGTNFTQSFNLTLDQAPAITSAPTATLTVGTAGGFTVTTTGFPRPSLTETGSLPSGVSFVDNGNGTASLAGTPAAGTGGSYSMTLTAHNGVVGDSTQSFTLVIHQAPAITSGNNTTFTVGQAGSFTVLSTGFPVPAVSESGSLPAGVTLTDHGDGTASLAGTPGLGTQGIYVITITAQNGVGSNATQSFTLEVGQVPSITSPNQMTFVVGTSGTFTVHTTGFPTPSLGESGTLPGGVTFIDNGNGTGTLAGTPAANTGGSYTLSLTAHNGIGSDATQTFTLTVDQAPLITSAASTSFTVGIAGSFTVQATGFPLPSLNDGSFSLPSGLTFTDNGDGTATLSGTAAAGTGGVYFITMHALNGVGSPATQNFALTIDEPPTITTPASTVFTVGAFGSFIVRTSHVFPAGVTLFESGSLPGGVTFVDNGDGTGTLSGTPAANTGGSYPLNLRATNGIVPDGTQNFTLTVDQPASITSGNNTTFTVGTLGGFTVTTTGFPSPVLTENGALPSGVTFVDNGNGTASLDGTPAAGTGKVYSFVITAHNGIGTNATQTFTLTVDQQPAITSASGATFTTGQLGTFSITSSGFPKPSLSEAGALPSGVTFHDNGNGTATLTGTPGSNAGGTYSLSITAHNGIGTDDTQSFTLTIDQPAAITSPSDKTFTVGSSDTFTVSTTGFPAPALSEGGTLPVGLNFTDNGDGTATLAGTPADGTGGSYTLVITAHNGVGTDATQTFTLDVDQPPAVSSPDNTTLIAGSQGSFTVTTTGFPAPTLSETGTLPNGLTFVDNGDGTATLTGTPGGNTGGTYTLSITAQNGVGSDATQAFTLTIDQAPSITSAASTTFTVGTLGGFTVTTAAFPIPSLSDGGFALPSGLTFTDNGNGTASLAGTPVAGTGGIYSFTLTAHNGVGGDALQTFTLTVDQAPAITSTDNHTYAVGTADSFTVTTTGFPAPALSESGALPGGVTFHDNGDGTARIAGTPAANTGGAYTVTLTAHNAVGSDATQVFTLTVDQPSAITSSPTHTATVGTPDNFTITTTGFPKPALTETGALPTGLSFTDNGNGTATLAGTPAAGVGGIYTLTLTAHNGIGSDATQSFTLTVNQSAAVTSSATTTFTVTQAGTFAVTTSGFPTPALSESGSLPSGVTFHDNGNGTATLAGMPGATTGGSYTITITAHNGVGADGTQTFTLLVDQPASITSLGGTTFTVGTAGTFTVNTNGFPRPALTETAVLPAGVTLHDNGDGSATLSGTPLAGAGGIATFTITAHNGIGTDATQTFTLTVDEAPAITSADQTTFTVGTAGTFTVSLAHDFPAASTLAESGTLPGGVTFVDNDNGTATLSGTAIAGTGGVYALTLTGHNGVAPDATQAFTLTIDEAPSIVSIPNATFIAGQVASAGLNTFLVQTYGYPRPTITDAGAILPAGVTFHDNGDGTATFSGLPAPSTGVYPLILTANSNTVGPASSQPFGLIVTAPPFITSANNATFVAGQPNAFTITTVPGIPTTAATITEKGTLPKGVSLKKGKNGTATLGGNPGAHTGGTYTITVTATNKTFSYSQVFTLSVDQAPAFIGATKAAVAMGQTTGLPVIKTTGLPVGTLQITGLPTGMDFVDNGNGTATLTGAAQQAGSFPLTVMATNPSGSATETFNLTVAALDVTSANSDTMTAGQSAPFTITTDATTGVKTTISEIGTLPAGIKLHDNGNGTAVLMGKPAANAGGTYAITLVVKSGGAVTNTPFTLTVTSTGTLPSFTGPASATLTAGQSLPFTITASAGTGTLKFTEKGKLPAGVSLKPNGTLIGKPAAKSGGVYPIQLTASNGAGQVTEAFTITVSQPLAITSKGVASFGVGQIGTLLVKSTGFPPASQWTLTGTVPPWVEIVANGNGTATLIGTPPTGNGVIGTYHFTVVAHNTAGSTASLPVTLTVSQSPVFVSSAGPVTFNAGQPMTFTIQTEALPTGAKVPKLTKTGTLPSGLKFKDNGNGTATISGTPKKPGTYKVLITANNGVAPAALQLLTLVIQ